MVPGPQGPAGADSTVPGPAGQNGQDGADSAIQTITVNGSSFSAADVTELVFQGAVGVAQNVVLTVSGLQGAPGADSTVPGPAGPAGQDGAASTVPGPAGPAGADSTVAGQNGQNGQHGQNGEDSTVPGPQGPGGAASTVAGPAGPAGQDGSDATVTAGTGNICLFRNCVEHKTLPSLRCDKRRYYYNLPTFAAECNAVQQLHPHLRLKPLD